MPGLTIATTINEVVALPIAYPATAAYPHEATHYLYIKAYTPRLPTEDTPRQLALANVPTDATEAHLKAIFANQLGGSRIETVAFDGAKTTTGIWTTAADTSVETVAGGEKRKRGQDDSSEHSKKKQKQKNGQAVAPRQVGELPSTWTRELHSSGAGAVITFADKASADSALREARKAAKSGTKIVWGQGVTNIEPLGRARYLEHHRLRYPPASELQASVNAYMAAYNTSEAVRARARAMASSQPDADGFVTVTRGARVAPAHTEAAKAKQEELRKRAKDRVKGDFYRFQLREQRKEGAKKLVAGFEEDQKRVEELRRRKGKVRPE